MANLVAGVDDSINPFDATLDVITADMLHSLDLNWTAAGTTHCVECCSGYVVYSDGTTISRGLSPSSRHRQKQSKYFGGPVAALSHGPWYT